MTSHRSLPPPTWSSETKRNVGASMRATSPRFTHNVGLVSTSSNAPLVAWGNPGPSISSRGSASFASVTPRHSYISSSKENPTGCTMPVEKWTPTNNRRPSASFSSQSPRHSYIPRPSSTFVTAPNGNHATPTRSPIPVSVTPLNKWGTDQKVSAAFRSKSPRLSYVAPENSTGPRSTTPIASWGRKEVGPGQASFRSQTDRNSYVPKLSSNTGSTKPVERWDKNCQKASASMVSQTARHSYIPKVSPW